MAIFVNPNFTASWILTTLHPLMIFFLPSLVVMCFCNSTIQWGCIGFATDSPNFMSTSTKGVPASNWQWISFAYHLLNLFFLWKPLHTWWTLSPRLDITYSCLLRHQPQSGCVFQWLLLHRLPYAQWIHRKL